MTQQECGQWRTTRFGSTMDNINYSDSGSAPGCLTSTTGNILNFVYRIYFSMFVLICNQKKTLFKKNNCAIMNCSHFNHNEYV